MFLRNWPQEIHANPTKWIRRVFAWAWSSIVLLWYNPEIETWMQIGDLQTDMREEENGAKRLQKKNTLLLWVGERQLEKPLPKDNMLYIILWLTLWNCLRGSLRDLDSPAFPAKNVLETVEGPSPSHVCLQWSWKRLWVPGGLCNLELSRAWALHQLYII